MAVEEKGVIYSQLHVLSKENVVCLTDDSNKKTVKKIDWMETFVLNEHYGSPYAILMKIDEIVRAYSAADGFPANLSAIERRMDAFSRDLGRVVMRAIQQNLDADTVNDGSKWQGRAGVFPKRRGNPGFSHLLFGLEKFDPLAEPKKRASDT